jgi:hypothetical protein
VLPAQSRMLGPTTARVASWRDSECSHRRSEPTLLRSAWRCRCSSTSGPRSCCLSGRRRHARRDTKAGSPGPAVRSPPRGQTCASPRHRPGGRPALSNRKPLEEDSGRLLSTRRADSHGAACAVARCGSPLRGERCLARWKDGHPVLQPRKVQENRCCRPARRDHREPAVLSPDPVVEIYERTEPARVDKADRAQVHQDRHRGSVSPRQRVAKLGDPREIELAVRSYDDRFGIAMKAGGAPRLAGGRPSAPNSIGGRAR